MRDILKQIWRFLRIAASGPGSRLSLLLLSASSSAVELTGIQITLRLIHWSADFYNALQKLDAPAAIKQIGVFCLLIGTVRPCFPHRPVPAQDPADPLAAAADGCAA